MTNVTRRKNDAATVHRREVVDQTINDNRVKNDELTRERRYEADKTMREHRIINDGITANRREIRDGNMWDIFTVFLLIFIVLAVGTFFMVM